MSIPLPFLLAAPAAVEVAVVVQEGAPQEAPPERAPSPFSSMLWPLIMIAAIFWLVVIGPERKNRKKREAMLNALEKGDRVMTTGGLFGNVASVQDNVVTLQVADGVRMRFARHAIQTVIRDDATETAAAKDPRTN